MSQRNITYLSQRERYLIELYKIFIKLRFILEIIIQH